MSNLISLIILEKINQVNHQNIIQPKNIDQNVSSQVQNVVKSKCFQLEITQSITINKAREVQSLNKLSHSKIVTSLLGAQTDLNNDKTATVSVAEIRLQNNKQTIYGTWNQNNGNTK